MSNAALTVLRAMRKKFGEGWALDERRAILRYEDQEFDVVLTWSDAPSGLLVRIFSARGGYHVIDSCFYAKIGEDTPMSIRRMIFRWRRELRAA